ncbi:MAG: hypothetical protein ACM31C_16385 [Acidobacteriota bacterium]
MVARAVSTGLACVLAACSPYGGGSYSCTIDSDCGGGGACKMGFCAFADPGCTASGYRYGDYSGPQSGQCVAGGSGSDAGVDAPDSGSNDLCYGSGLVQACFAATPSGTKTYTTNTTINTDDTSTCMAVTSSSAWCVIAAQTIDVDAGATLTAHGSRPLVLVATQSISISGTLDVSSRRGGTPGAGADAAGCNAGTAPSAAGGGGAGGSFGGQGGNGGARFDGSAGGIAGGALVPTALRGGCKGQDGGGTTGGAGGAGGGGVYLIASTSIFVSGAIDASGAGGTTATNNSSGGGGGGAGGYIGLESPSVQNSGSIFANGGGGGEASGSTTAGTNGSDPTAPGTPAPGGSLGSTNGGDGGDGAAGATLTGGTGTMGNTGGGAGGGGGGGGGGGILHVQPSATLGGQSSPPAT